MQMFHLMFKSVARMQLEQVETQKELTAVKEVVEVMQETFLQHDPDWRKTVNSLLNACAYRSGGDYSETRNDSYRILEDRGHCILSKRLRNLKTRLEERGASKTQLNAANRLDVIEEDARLKEIYLTICKELSIGSLAVVKG